MGLLDFLKGPDIDQGVRQFEQTPGAVLLDVRTPGEYGEGRISGSRNLPPVRNRKLLIPENTAGIPRLKIPAIPSIILIISSTITLISPAGRKAENC